MSSRQLDEEAIFHVARGILEPGLRSTYLDQVCAVKFLDVEEEWKHLATARLQAEARAGEGGLGVGSGFPFQNELLNEVIEGPLVVGFREGGMLYGLIAALVTLWATFVPCFLWIFAGAPYIDWIGAQSRLRGALTAITAAVVGVILNLSIWFALHVFFTEVSMQRHGWLVLWQPELASIQWTVIGLSLICGWFLFRRHWGVAKVLGLAALAGLGLQVL